MMDYNVAVATVIVLALSCHLISIALAIYRVTRPASAVPPMEAVSILRPVCGVDLYDRVTLETSFRLDHWNYEVIFCCAKDHDPAVRVVKELIAKHPDTPAKLLIGDDRTTSNPKLNNLIKGWNAATSSWIVLADSNVEMPPDYLSELAAAWREDTGLVCSPPVGSRPLGFWAHIECAFLNTYQARWQLAADTAGLGFAQGKSMFWRRDVLDEAGGITALGREIAEDAVATKIVRQRCKRVRLVDRPFEQPLGYRSAQQVLDRQVRWAKLRRATFARYYMPEILTGVLPALFGAIAIAPQFGLTEPQAIGLLLCVWYLPEAALNRLAGWNFTGMTPLAWLARDLLIPAVWVSGWMGNGFTWRGNQMNVAASTAHAAIPAFSSTERSA